MVLLLLLFAPLISFLLIVFFSKYIDQKNLGILACTSIFVSFLTSIFCFFNYTNDIYFELFNWILFGENRITFALSLDHLSLTYCLFITGIGSLIHVYATSYMHNDEHFKRFFAYLNLFVFFMLILVLGNNLLITFIGWEGVGLCSYLLIGFWHRNNKYNDAAQKAFVMNRIGDLGFLSAIILIYINFGTLEYALLAEKITLPSSIIPIIAMLLLMGSVGKSAQMPLFTWLPDAMAGPTPVSALIHAATMVTAGIYLIVRNSFIFSLAPDVLPIIMWIGTFTAIFAASIGIFQTDIKKILAYSTVSQLGFMFAALGVGAYTAAVFHVITHAFFKALLFLGAGSIIHGNNHEQDIRKMGGLRKKMPTTYITFFIATLAISGIPPFAGFFSKDEILVNIFTQNKGAWLLLIIAAAMTTFYMFRLLFLTFFGSYRGEPIQEKNIHESPKLMTIPLLILAFLSIVGGFINLPEIITNQSYLSNYLKSSIFKTNHNFNISHTTEYFLIIITVGLSILMIALAAYLYLIEKRISNDDNKKNWLHKIIFNKFYVDELYQNYISKPIYFLANLLQVSLENLLIFCFSNTQIITNKIAYQIRRIQTGKIEHYFFALFIGIALFIYLKKFI